MKKLFFISFILFAGLPSLHSQSCSYTSFRNAFYLTGDTIRILHQINTDDDGQLWVGKATKYGSSFSDGLIVKFDASLNIVWAKRINSNQPLTSLILNNVIESPNGGYIIAGYSIRKSGNTELAYYLLHCDRSGNTSWQREYPVSPTIGTWSDISLTGLTQDDASIYIAGTLNGDISEQSGQFAVVLKTDVTGNLAFGKLFYNSNVYSNSLIGIFPENDNLLLWGFGEDDNNIQTDTRRLYWMRLDVNDCTCKSGEAFCFKQLSLSPISYAVDAHLFKAFKTTDGYGISGLLAENAGTNRALSVLHFSSSLLITRSWMLPRITGVIDVNAGDFSIDKNGNMMLAQRSKVYADKTYLTLYNRDGDIVRQNRIGKFGPSTAKNLTDGGVAIRMQNNNIRVASNYLYNGTPVSELLSLSLGSVDTICFGEQTRLGAIHAFETYTMPATQFNMIDNIVTEKSASFHNVSVSIQSVSICSSESTCKQLSLSGEDTVCVFGQSVKYSVQRNQHCSAPIKWSFDSTNCMNATTLSDSSILIQWRNSIAGMQTTKLAATLDNCNTVSDTLSIVLIPFVRPFQRDTSICAGDSIQLSPGNWFKHYKWQDGSEDSIFIAKKPGFYKVVYKTFCNRVFEDSVTISPLKVELLPDTMLKVCKGDSIRLEAKPGFSNYQWHPDYHIESTLANLATFTPTVDTSYFVTALINQGCRAYDTIKIKVMTPADFKIKKEQESCQEIILVPQSSSHLSEVLWSGEASVATASIKTEKSGWYFISAKDKNGCHLKDSINIQLLSCVNRITFPNAFTPNKDGLNDLFRPIVAGRILSYELSIYNRWGQKIFYSQNPSVGWDGTISGKPQHQQSFVWICTYQLMGKQVITKKGTIVLIK